MKEFHPEKRPGEPTLKLGQRVPPEGVNLAYVHSPPVTADQVQIIDLSQRIPGNVALQHTFKADMFVDDNRLLRDVDGRSIIPLENVVVTDEYAGDTPLFWRAISRHYHYEEGIQEGEYRGEKISVLRNGQKVDKPYKIILKMTAVDHVYKVHVLMSFKPSVDEEYYLHYHRCNAQGQSVQTSHRELLNPQTIYMQVDKDVVMAAPLGEKLFSVDLDLDEAGFEVSVPATSTIVQRNPVWIRWRAHALGGGATSWYATQLYKKEALHPEEYVEHGQQIYIDDGDHAWKILHPNLRSLLRGREVGSVSVQVWNGSEWTNSNIVTIRYGENNRLEAAVTDVATDTGIADMTKAARGLVPKEVPFTLKVTAYEDKPGTADRIIQYNITPVADITSNLNTSAFPENSPASRLKTLGLTSPGTLLLTSLANSLSSFFGYSREEKNPSTASTTITMDWSPRQDNVKKIQIHMGSRGTPDRLVVDGTTIWGSGAGSVPQPINKSGRRTYEHVFSTPRSVERIQVSIKPDKWFVRPVYKVVWFIFKFSFFQYNAYKSGFHVSGIDVYKEELIPGTTPWSDESRVSGFALRQAPYRVSLKDLLEMLGLMPPPGRDLSVVKYRIELEDPDHRINLHVRQKGLELLPEGNAFIVRHQDLATTMIEVSTDEYELKSSPKFSLTTDNPGNVFVMPPSEVEDDSAWRLRINNGRFQIKDFVAGYLRDYFVPEFGAQAFDPAIPFRRVVGERPIFESRRRIRVRHAPLHVQTEYGEPVNLVVRRGAEILRISDWNEATGQIYLSDRIEFTDNIEVDYVYQMTYLEYGGFFDGEHFYHLDLCPHPGRTYTDLDNPSIERSSSELLEKDIYIYCIPTYQRMLSLDGPETPTQGEPTIVHGQGAIRHWIVNEGVPETLVEHDIQTRHPGAVLLAKVQVRRTHLPENIISIDTRRRGGGVSAILTEEEALRLYPQAEAFWDFGYYDGRPYPSNSILIITIPESVRSRVSEEELRRFLAKTVDLGVYPALRFIPDD